MDKFNYLDFENNFGGTSSGQKHWYLKKEMFGANGKKLENSKY